MKYNKSLFLGVAATSLFFNCSTLKVTSTSIEKLESIHEKKSDLTEKEANSWGHLDIVKDSIPGMSVEKAYNEIIKDNEGKTVIVAVIDSGIDIDHEDLNDVVWVNEKEIPGNGIDDDKNGYIDDINGWNFLGESYDENLEYIRLLKTGKDFDRKKEALAKFENEYPTAKESLERYTGIINSINEAQTTLNKHFEGKEYSLNEVMQIKTEDKKLTEAVGTAGMLFSFGLEDFNSAKEELQGAVDYFGGKVNYYLNKDFNGRTTGDNPDDFTQMYYGNGNVKHTIDDESHGTHVAGIIGAERGNNLGVDGIANNVRIMAIRAVPNGDEYDKDVALAIRYAADNGAKVINTSFGKSYSPHSDKVREAIAYAETKDVLIVNAAGNDGIDLDKNFSFPNDAFNNGKEISNNFITVGSLFHNNGDYIISDFSNYGKINVDVFAPGSKIYSTFPNNNYKAISGTSMASPAVAGVAALVRSYFPKLSASDVKKVILESGLEVPGKFSVGGNEMNKKYFNEISTTGKIVNAYNALIFASKL